METNKCSDSKDSNIPESTNNVLSLPSIVLDKIFDFLSHTQKLTSRLVCKDWDIQISSILSKTSYFMLNSREGNQILLDSNVQWTKLKITGTFVLSQQFKNCITTLNLCVPGFPKYVTMWKERLIEFPNVTNLQLSIDDGNSKSESQCERKEILTPNLDKKFNRIVERLVSLTITFPFNDYTNLQKCLREFIAGMRLTKLSIMESSSPNPEKSFPVELFSRMRTIIFKSSRSLKYLELDFNSETIRRKLVPSLISHLCNLENLKLKSALIRYDPIQKYIDRDFEILSKFLMAQMGSGELKNIVLPWTTNAALCQEFIKSIPPDIESIGNLRSEHFTKELPNNFKKLVTLSMVGYISRTSLSEKFSSIKRLHVNLGENGFLSYIGGITNKFSNLTELIISNESSFPIRFDFQDIIRNLKKLQVLHIESSHITDFDLTGLKQDEAMELLLTKRLYFDKEINQRSRLLNKPLCSLQKLEKLILAGSRLTDVGLVLGFQFGSSLKHLTIGSDSDEVSDLGLYFIGANNSGLETFEGVFKSPKISMAGIVSLAQQLPMIKSTHKFSVINEKPVVINQT